MATTLTYALLAMFGTLCGVILVRMLTGDISTSGFMHHAQNAEIAAERCQALIVSVAIPIAYAAQCVFSFDQSILAMQMPDPPSWMAYAAGGSQIAYLTGKIFRRLA